MVQTVGEIDMIDPIEIMVCIVVCTTFDILSKKVYNYIKKKYGERKKK